MTDQHPITPPPEVLTKCYKQAERQSQAGYSLKFVMNCVTRTAYAAGHAAGANQELEACCEWVQSYAECGDSLRAARRPKPPSLREQALKALEIEDDSMPLRSLERGDRFALIRRALEQLDD